jgi:enolase
MKVASLQIFNLMLKLLSAFKTAIENAGYKFGEDISLSLDCAA